jgi:hypothetical protein
MAKAKAKVSKQVKGKKQAGKSNGAAAPFKARVARKGTIEFSIMTGIAKGMSPQDNLARVQKAHKGCKTSIYCVYWYQDKARKGLVTLA